MARVTAEAAGVSTQAQHPVHLRDNTDHTGVVAHLLRPPRSALQASDTPEQQVTLIDYVVNVYPTSWSPSDNTAFPFETLSTSCELLGFSLP